MLKNPEIQIFEIQPEDIGVVILKINSQEKPYRCIWTLGGTDGALSVLDNPADILEYGKNGIISCLVNNLDEANDFVKKSYNEWYTQYEKDYQLKNSKKLDYIKKYLNDNNENFLLPLGDEVSVDLNTIITLCKHLNVNLTFNNMNHENKNMDIIITNNTNELLYRNPSNDLIVELILLNIPSYDKDNIIFDKNSFQNLLDEISVFLNK